MYISKSVQYTLVKHQASSPRPTAHRLWALFQELLPNEIHQLREHLEIQRMSFISEIQRKKILSFKKKHGAEPLKNHRKLGFSWFLQVRNMNRTWKMNRKWWKLTITGGFHPRWYWYCWNFRASRDIHLFLLSHAMMGVEPLVLVDFKGLKNLIFHWSNLARSVKHLEYLSEERGTTTS